VASSVGLLEELADPLLYASEEFEPDTLTRKVPLKPLGSPKH